MRGWLAEGSGFELLVVGLMLGTATDTTIRTPRENSPNDLLEANIQAGLRLVVSAMTAIVAAVRGLYATSL